jgi:hypothetical protein
MQAEPEENAGALLGSPGTTLQLPAIVQMGTYFTSRDEVCVAKTYF